MLDLDAVGITALGVGLLAAATFCGWLAADQVRQCGHLVANGVLAVFAAMMISLIGCTVVAWGVATDVSSALVTLGLSLAVTIVVAYAYRRELIVWLSELWEKLSVTDGDPSGAG